MPPRQLQPWEEFRRPKECTFREVWLRPGDVWCLPAGTWHDAEASGHSLAINMAFSTRSFWAVLSPAVGRGLIRREQWRQSPPPFLSNELGEGIPDYIREFFVARLDELIELLVALREKPDSLQSLWRSFLGEYGRQQSQASDDGAYTDKP